MGANESSLQRHEGLLNLFFFTLNKCDALAQLLEQKKAYILRLKEFLFGKDEMNTEEDDVSSDQGDNSSAGANDGDEAEQNAEENNEEGEAAEGTDTQDTTETNFDRRRKKDPKEAKGGGHGRLPVEAYTGAEIVECSHEHLSPGDICPECQQTKLYSIDPQRRIVFTGQAPLIATHYELERLRCAPCGA